MDSKELLSINKCVAVTTTDTADGGSFRLPPASVAVTATEANTDTADGGSFRPLMVAILATIKGVTVMATPYPGQSLVVP